LEQRSLRETGGRFLAAGGAPREAAEEARACIWLPEGSGVAGDRRRWGCSRARGDGGTSSYAAGKAKRKEEGEGAASVRAGELVRPDPIGAEFRRGRARCCSGSRGYNFTPAISRDKVAFTLVKKLQPFVQHRLILHIQLGLSRGVLCFALKLLLFTLSKVTTELVAIFIYQIQLHRFLERGFRPVL
jgi:hypothetical protein